MAAPEKTYNQITLDDDPYVASADAFYETFSGGVLSGLIVARGA
jgi:hypothetical protein